MSSHDKDRPRISWISHFCVWDVRRQGLVRVHTVQFPMSMNKLSRSLSSRSIKVDKAKPLKSPTKSDSQSSFTTGPFDELLSLVEKVSNCLVKKSFNDLSALLSTMAPKLKLYGPRVEEIHKDQLDKAFVHFRNGCREEELDHVSRMILLQLVELRAMGWHSTTATNHYYLSHGSSDTSIPDSQDALSTSSSFGNVPQALLLSPGEVIKPSGKFSAPTKMPGKNYCRDEVVIRNADSGKVSPGAKERLVQITGPDSDKIEFARQLMEDTIKRNASPVRESERDIIGSNSSLNSIGGSDDDSGGLLSAGRSPTGLPRDLTNEYKYTVTHKGATVSLTCPNLEIIQKSKIILEMFLPKADDFSWLEKIRNDSGVGLDSSNVDADVTPTPSPPSINNRDSSEREEVTTPSTAPVSPSSPVPSPSSPPPVTGPPATLVKRKIIREYSRQFLLDRSSDKFSLEKPPGWDFMLANCQEIIRSERISCPSWNPEGWTSWRANSLVDPFATIVYKFPLETRVLVAY